MLATSKKAPSVLKNEKQKSTEAISTDKKALERKAISKNTKPLKTVKKNVMTSVHNVTVSSPPPSASKEKTRVEDISAIKGHNRSRTRTIASEDSLLHQQKMMKQKQGSNGASVYKTSQERVKNEKVENKKESIKNPVAYELNFGKAKKSKKEPQTTTALKCKLLQNILIYCCCKWNFDLTSILTFFQSNLCR